MSAIKRTGRLTVIPCKFTLILKKDMERPPLISDDLCAFGALAPPIRLMPIRLHDSLSREVRALRTPNPSDPKDVFTFYNCGPTVYGPAHIGNFRTFVINDVLRRLLELEFGRSEEHTSELQS